MRCCKIDQTVLQSISPRRYCLNWNRVVSDYLRRGICHSPLGLYRYRKFRAANEKLAPALTAPPRGLPHKLPSDDDHDAPLGAPFILFFLFIHPENARELKERVRS